MFIFNRQIEMPPHDFIKLVEQRNKNFLWGGTAKIAHNSIIADYSEGGMKYKDLYSFILSVNIKFLCNINNNDDLNCFLLPKLWINQIFNINLAENSYIFEILQK